MTVAIYRVGWMLLLNVFATEAITAVYTETWWLLYPALFALIGSGSLAHQADKARKDAA